MRVDNNDTDDHLRSARLWCATWSFLKLLERMILARELIVTATVGRALTPHARLECLNAWMLERNRWGFEEMHDCIQTAKDLLL